MSVEIRQRIANLQQEIDRLKTQLGESDPFDLTPLLQNATRRGALGSFEWSSTNLVFNLRPSTDLILFNQAIRAVYERPFGAKYKRDLKIAINAYGTFITALTYPAEGPRMVLCVDRSELEISENENS